MFLTEIIELKKKRLAQAKAKRNFDELRQSATDKRRNAKRCALRENLRENRINIIAEIKRASPSKGVINDKIDVAAVAKSYEKGGASAISVLTEEDNFKGSLKDLKLARSIVEIPVLRKDFIFDEFQVYESADAGADVILLIAAMLEDKNLANLYRLAELELGLDVLLEVHTLEELERAKAAGAKIIGVNNRDLHSFKVSLDVSRKLIKHAPKNALMIAESGLQTREDLIELKDLGFDGFLIGEILMRSGNPFETLKHFLG